MLAGEVIHRIGWVLLKIGRVFGGRGCGKSPQSRAARGFV